MLITFSPSRAAPLQGLSVNGAVLTINGEAFDFSALGDGDTLPHGAIASDLIVGDVTNVDGEVHITVVLPHGPNAPYDTRYPSPVTVTSGAVPIPSYDAGA